MTHSTKPVSPLRRRMIEDMTMRKLAPATQRGYLAAVRGFTRFFDRSPDQATADGLRDYQLHLVNQGISSGNLKEPSNHTLKSMIAGFLDSAEFERSADTDSDGAVSNDEFVNHMYLGVFGRPPDEEGYNFWIGELDSGARDQAKVLEDMTQSNEFVLQTVDAAVDYLVG